MCQPELAMSLTVIITCSTRGTTNYHLRPLLINENLYKNMFKYQQQSHMAFEYIARFLKKYLLRSYPKSNGEKDSSEKFYLPLTLRNRRVEEYELARRRNIDIEVNLVILLHFTKLITNLVP